MPGRCSAGIQSASSGCAIVAATRTLRSALIRVRLWRENAERVFVMTDAALMTGDMQPTVNHDPPSKSTDGKTIDGPAPERKHPYFIISSLMMLVGCLLISHAAHSRPDELSPLLILAGVYLLYQWSATAVGVWIVKHTGSVTLASIQLFVIVTLFLCDLTMVHQEVATASPMLGTILTILSLASGLAQLIWIVKTIGVHVQSEVWFLVVFNLLTLLMLPAIIKWSQQRGGWGTEVGAELVMGWAIAGWLGLNGWAITSWLWHERRPWAIFLLAASGGSAIIHAGTLHWVYDLDIAMTTFSAVLLMLGGLLIGTRHSILPWIGGWFIVAFSTLFDFINSPSYCSPVWELIVYGRMNTQLLYFAIAAAMLGLIAWRRRQILSGLISGTAAFLALLPMLPDALVFNLDRAFFSVWDFIFDARHWGPMRWGMVLVVGAFVMLAIGAWHHRRMQQRLV